MIEHRVRSSSGKCKWSLKLLAAKLLPNFVVGADKPDNLNRGHQDRPKSNFNGVKSRGTSKEEEKKRVGNGNESTLTVAAAIAVGTL